VQGNLSLITPNGVNYQIPRMIVEELGIDALKAFIESVLHDSVANEDQLSFEHTGIVYSNIADNEFVVIDSKQNK
jgi:hypothetical protein